MMGFHTVKCNLSTYKGKVVDYTAKTLKIHAGDISHLSDKESSD